MTGVAGMVSPLQNAGPVTPDQSSLYSMDSALRRRDAEAAVAKQRRVCRYPAAPTSFCVATSSEINSQVAWYNRNALLLAGPAPVQAGSQVMLGHLQRRHAGSAARKWRPRYLLADQCRGARRRTCRGSNVGAVHVSKRSAGVTARRDGHLNKEDSHD
jgi:hypothetical protein